MSEALFLDRTGPAAAVAECTDNNAASRRVAHSAQCSACESVIGPRMFSILHIYDTLHSG